MTLPDGAGSSPLEHGIVLLLLVERIVDKVWERWKALRTQADVDVRRGERMGRIEDEVAELRGRLKAPGAGSDGK
jgi:hypothetical protein